MDSLRLLLVAKALRESPKPERFTMDMWAHECGTPACALGHYAARRDLQSAFYLDEAGSLHSCRGHDLVYVDTHGVEIADHFGITPEDVCVLFEAKQWDIEEDTWATTGGGCGGAKTAIEAAEFIERWVAQEEAKP